MSHKNKNDNTLPEDFIPPKVVLERIAALKKRGLLDDPKFKQLFLETAAQVLGHLGAFQEPPPTDDENVNN